MSLAVASLSAPPRPWLNITNLRDYGHFKTLVRERFVRPTDQGELRRLIRFVFYGSDLREDLTPRHLSKCGNWERKTS